MPSRKVELEEVPFDSLADRGQYRAFQRAYGKENQAMLTLIVLTVAWSYAAHVYGHGTVFVWFTRTLMTVLVCLVIFQALKLFHRNFEALVLSCGVKNALLDSLAQPRPLDPKKKPKRAKNRAKPDPAPSEPEPTPAPTPAPVVQPAKQSKLKAEKPAVPEKKKKKAATKESKTPSQVAAEKALAQAKAEAAIAHDLFQQAKKAEAAALQQSRSPPKPVLTEQLPLPRPVGHSPMDSPKASYVPPHLREGYKGSASKPLPPRVKRVKKDSPTNTVHNTMLTAK